MNVKQLLELVDKGEESGNKAIKELGQKYRHWEKQETYELLKETVHREIFMAIDQVDFEQGQDRSALMFAYIKGMKSILNRLEWYKYSEQEVIAREKEEESLKEEEQEDNKFKAGLEAGPDSGLNSIV